MILWWRVLKRAVLSQVRESRNLREGIPAKLVRLFWACVLLGKALRAGLYAMRKEQIGSAVVYRGDRCTVSNWAGSESPNLVTPKGYVQGAQRNEIANVVDGHELWHRFAFGVEFYLMYWYAIDVNKRVHPRAFAAR